MIRFFLGIIFSFTIATCFAQNTITVQIQFENEKLILDKYYRLDKDSFQISKCKFYLSHLRLFNKSELVYTFQKQYFLMDASKEETLHIPFDGTLPSFDKIEFALGVDSLTSVSGVFENDLDPIHDMFWSWQSGYVNFKLEGYIISSKHKKNEFLFHIGGYAFPYNCLRRIQLNTNYHNNPTLILNLNALIDQKSLKENNNIMSPNKMAMDFSDKLQKCFSWHD